MNIAGISNVLHASKFDKIFDEKNGPRTITIQEYKNGKKYGQGAVIKEWDDGLHNSVMHENDEPIVCKERRLQYNKAGRLVIERSKEEIG